VRSLELAIKYLAGERIIGTAAERAAMVTGVYDFPDLSNGTIFEETDTGKHYIFDGSRTEPVALENDHKIHAEDVQARYTGGGVHIGDPYDTSEYSAPSYSPRYMGEQVFTGNPLVGVKFNQVRWVLGGFGDPAGEDIDGTLTVRVYSESSYGEISSGAGQAGNIVWNWTSNTGVPANTIKTGVSSYLFGDGTQAGYTFQNGDAIFIVMNDNTHNHYHYVVNINPSGYASGTGSTSGGGSPSYSTKIEWNETEGWQNGSGDIGFILYNPTPWNEMT